MNLIPVVEVHQVVVQLSILLAVVLSMEEVAVISKEELRTLAKEKRLLIENKEDKDILILNKVLHNKKIQEAADILIYVSKNLEVDTYNIIKELWNLGKNVYVPKIINKELEFFKIKDFSELQKGKFDIYEPLTKEKFANKNPSCIIVPGLLFDNFGNRLGYGGGYYDCFLARNTLYKIGLCYQDFKVLKLDVDSYDIKMDEIITEEVLWNLKD